MVSFLRYVVGMGRSISLSPPSLSYVFKMAHFSLYLHPKNETTDATATT